MKVESLSPRPEHRTQFAWSHHTTVPEEPGCYALATHAGDVSTSALQPPVFAIALERISIVR